MGKGILLFSLVLLVIFGACAFVTLKYTLKPLQRISDAAAEISPRSLDARLNTSTVPTEIAPLVESFNRVLDRLEQGYRTQREFLATAAHELKTPLALIRAQIELSTDNAGRAELLQDVAHMSRQVQQLLHLAEASEVQSRQLARVDLTALVEEAATYLERMAQALGVRFELPRTSAPVHWMADRCALFTLVKNLLENAVQHTPPGTLVSVEVSPRSLSVRDWGPGVPQDQLQMIFARFWRGAHRRDLGAGLGLAICQEIALAHGWTLAASRADPGLRIVLSRLDA
ncbi:sensor histidine kinase [Roseateles flavus]